MLKKLNYFFHHPTLRNVGIVTTGNIANAILGFISLIIVSRTLGPAHFGVFSVVFGFYFLISKLGDLGSNSTAVKYISLFKSQKKEKDAQDVLAFFLGITYLFIFVYLIILIPFYKQIALLLNIQNYSIYILFALISAIGLILFNTYSVILQSLEKFNEFVLYYSVATLVKILGVLFLSAILFLNLTSAITIYFISPFIGFFGMFFVIHFVYKYKAKPNLSRSTLKKISPFFYFMMFASVFAAINEQVGVFFSNIFFSNFDAGIWGASSRLSSVFSLIAASIGTVLIPRASRYTDIKNIKNFAYKSILLGLVLFVAVLPVSIFPEFFITLTAGEAYITGAPILAILCISGAFSILTAGFSSVFFSLNKAQYFTFVSIFNLVFQIPLMFLLGDMFGLIGLAYSQLVIAISILLISIFYYLINLKQKV
ncbi:oligosaccharide flippase family protein [Patescibacteria group bacterium]|nr:oligosaccharide flippase family protein [Patescibacteria group bacterium]